MTYFCPGCWRIIPADAKICPFCGCDLAAAEMRSYPERLIGALHHPVPENRLLAAEILGELRYRPAMEPLLARAREELQEHPPDFQFLATLLRAARDCGAPEQEWQVLLAQANSRLLYKLMEK
ncbi:MAG: zinc ribbon domain-containing protein [candidate division KSB1 bacterium]|nr:zinc ribbon domain-containing protein [candidate division KSB1 bacterium]